MSCRCEPLVIGGSETILLAEDEEAVRLLVCQLLRAHGYSVICARSGAEALQLVRQGTDPIDLILTDLVMPGMGGRELASKASVIRPDIKVLYMSGYPLLAMAENELADSRVPFCHEPISPTTLLCKVREVLDSRAPR